VSEDKYKAARQEFAQWFASNYPGPDTIIHDPFWHAPKVFRAALTAIERNAQSCGDAEQADAPQKLCSICHGYGRYQDGNSGTESDGYAPNIVECECAPEERFPKTSSMPSGSTARHLQMTRSSQIRFRAAHATHSLAQRTANEHDK
jgi:hypothetical protein